MGVQKNRQPIKKSTIQTFRKESDRIYTDLVSQHNSDSYEQVIKSFYNRLSGYFEDFFIKEDNRIKCREGCCFCCSNTKVIVYMPEVLLICKYILNHIEPEIIQQIWKRLSTAVKTIYDIYDVPSRFQRQCPFLEQMKCLIYEVRPANCRQYHSINVDICEHRYINPSAKLPESVEPELKLTLHAAIAGFEDAFTRMGMDMKRLEFVKTLFLVLGEHLDRDKPGRKLKLSVLSP